MIASRESIYSALFSQLNGALLTPTGPFKIVSRHWRPPDQISPADRPALYQVQKDEIAAKPQVNALPTKWAASVDLVIYTSGSTDLGNVPSTELNSLLDAVETAVKAVTPGLNQTLGGKVIYCRVEGKIEIVENVSGAMALAVIPISLEITS